MKHDMNQMEPLGRSQLSHKRVTPFQIYRYGATYYPEHWSDDDRREDAQRMAAAGFNVVRMAEFAWDRIEPEEGRYDFALFDDTIARLGKVGIDTFLCTPTATPPRWLTQEHPEILRVDHDGRAMQHGSRQHACHAHPLFRAYSRKITRAMAEHYAQNPHVIGWQTDNEFNCHFSECYCDACRVAFVRFLTERYPDIGTLNEAWGTAFWAQTYQGFGDIPLPCKYRPAAHNPGQMLDYYRFISHTITVFLHDQVEILRAVNPRWTVFHNGLFAHIDYRGPFTRDLDVLGWDCYPFFKADPAVRRYWQTFGLDRTRGLSGNFVVPEQQCNGGGWLDGLHATPEPGEMRMLFYVSMARGADGIQFFRWRTARFGAEEYWRGILDHDNIPRRRYAEAAQIGRELKAIGTEVLGTAVRVDAAIAACDQDVHEAHSAMPLSFPAPDRVAEDLHQVLLDQGFATGLVHPEDDLDEVKLYVIPHWSTFDPRWVTPLTRFVERGGVLVIGARTGTKDMTNRVVKETPPGCLAELVGATVQEAGKIENGIRPLFFSIDGGAPLTAAEWYEELQPNEGTAVVAKWQSRYLTGKAAITKRKRGKGCVFYVGTQFTKQVLQALLPLVVEESGIEPLVRNMPAALSVSVRANAEKELWFVINHADGPVSADLPGGVDLLTGQRTGGPKELAAFEVVMIRKPRSGG
jgi:beta-galactosidase